MWILLALAVPGLSYTSAVAGPTVASLVAKPRACRYSPCVLELLRIFSKDVDEHDTATQLNLRQNYVAILSERSPSALKLYTSRFGRDATPATRRAPPLYFHTLSHVTSRLVPSRRPRTTIRKMAHVCILSEYGINGIPTPAPTGVG